MASIVPVSKVSLAHNNPENTLTRPTSSNSTHYPSGHTYSMNKMGLRVLARSHDSPESLQDTGSRFNMSSVRGPRYKLVQSILTVQYS